MVREHGSDRPGDRSITPAPSMILSRRMGHQLLMYAASRSLDRDLTVGGAADPTPSIGYRKADVIAVCGSAENGPAIGEGHVDPERGEA